MKIKKRLLFVLTSIALIAALTVPAFASYEVIDTCTIGTLGSGYLSALSTRVYAETTANNGGIEGTDDNWQDVELFIESQPVDYEITSGMGMTTVWLVYEDSGETVQSLHTIRRGNAQKTGSIVVNP